MNVVLLIRRQKFYYRPRNVVRREGNSFTLLVCPHLGGGYRYPIMLCNISHNAMGQLGGYPTRSSRGGRVPCQGVPTRGGTLPGVPCQGGTLRGTLLGGYPAGGTQLGQHREYLLHGGQYASCVHARRTFLLMEIRCLVLGYNVTVSYQ